MDIRLDLTGQLTESLVTFVISAQVHRILTSAQDLWIFWSSGIDRRQFWGRSNKDLVISDGFDHVPDLNQK